ncbi:hypothetical protein L6164_020093 [Bauhinia variegata]|uniref:Uncharacterized protein n=2 Tax=Bauhinia variegata TaxID=167791 RepID=A0ACB9MTY1_BAUVA|nr:hypothetical protein L6164_020093 [Bauhinia variegata]
MPRVRRSARLKEKRKQDEVMDSSHSDLPHSLSFMNAVSESWECPTPPSGKHLIPDATIVFSRRASLRSTKRLNEEAPSVSRCSQPQKSKEHSAADDLSQQLDDLVDNMITSECQASAGYLPCPQVANPSTLTPATMHEADSASMKVNGLEGECIPLEQVPLAEDIQASNGFQERVNKGHSKSTSMVARPCPSFSLNLTEMVQMWNEEDDEVDSIRLSLSMDVVDGYQVKPEYMPILRKIISKHGDIANSCTVTRMKYRSHLLEMTCDIIIELQDKNLSKIKEDDLQEMISAVNELKTTKLDIGWLHQRLVEILEVRQMLKESGKLKEKKESIRQTIEIVERELKACEAEKMAIEARYQSILDREIVCKKNLTRARNESAMINATISDAKSKVKRFLNCSLADGLL